MEVYSAKPVALSIRKRILAVALFWILLVTSLMITSNAKAETQQVQIGWNDQFGSKLIFHNGVVVTMEEDMPTAQAIAIEGDCIVAVGTNEEILALVDADTRVVDLCGRTVLPGFIDSHAHWIWGIDDAGLGTAYQTGHRWLPPWCFDDRAVKGATALDGIHVALKGGWTSVSELFANQWLLDEVLALDDAGELRVRVNAYLALNSEFERFGNWYLDYSPGQEFGSKVRIGGVKIFADDADYGHSVFFSQDELTALVSKAHDEGYQIAIHAMDTGIDLVLNAYEQALQGESNAVYRHRVEHLCVLRDDQLDRMAQLGLIASIQLPWFTSNPWDIYDVRKWIGLDRADLVGRWHDILVAGIPSIGSTDYPWFYGADGSAMTTIYKAVTRIGEPCNQRSPQWVLDQRITIEQALRLLTIDAAYGTFQEDVKGSIAVGKFADLAVLSENPLAVPEERLMDVYVLMTMVGGQVEYCAPGHEYLYGSVYSEAPVTSYLGTSSNVFLQTPTEELLVTSEAVTSYKESA